MSSDTEPELPALSRRDYIIHEVEYLLGTDGLESIARRLGYANIASLQRKLLAYGRSDLAAEFTLKSLYPRDVNVVPSPPRNRKGKPRQKGYNPPTL